MLNDPGDETVFERSKIDWQEAARNKSALRFTRELLRLRKSDPVIAKQDSRSIDGAVLTAHAFVLRWFDIELGDRLLLVNLSTDEWLDPGSEPLLAPSKGCYWDFVWSSERVAYGGFGGELPETDHGWYLPGETAVLLAEQLWSEAQNASSDDQA
jgi:maltooligosyltrehalose trehalohydrolase